MILDTNVTFSDPLLRAPIHQALLYALIRIKGQVLYPDLLVDEVLKHIFTELPSQSKLNYLVNIVVGKRVTLPNKDQIRHLWNQRMKALSLVIQECQISSEHLSKAALRVINDRPPSHVKKGQVVDCAVWELARELSKDYDVWIVSADNDYRRDKDGDLHPDLVAEVEDSSVVLFRDVSSCLRVLSDGIPEVDFSPIIPSLDQTSRAWITAALQSFFRTSPEPFHPSLPPMPEIPLPEIVSDITESVFDAYPTEEENKECITFKISYELSQPKSRATVHGTVGYDIAQGTLPFVFEPIVSHIFFENLDLPWGERQTWNFPCQFSLSMDAANIPMRTRELFRPKNPYTPPRMQPHELPLLKGMSERERELEREVADLKRQNEEIRNEWFRELEKAHPYKPEGPEGAGEPSARSDV